MRNQLRLRLAANMLTIYMTSYHVIKSSTTQIKFNHKLTSVLSSESWKLVDLSAFIVPLLIISYNWLECSWTCAPVVLCQCHEVNREEKGSHNCVLGLMGTSLKTNLINWHFLKFPWGSRPVINPFKAFFEMNFVPIVTVMEFLVLWSAWTEYDCSKNSNKRPAMSLPSESHRHKSPVALGRLHHTPNFPFLVRSTLIIKLAPTPHPLPSLLLVIASSIVS